jgi:hypothetical protein
MNRMKTLALAAGKRPASLQATSRRLWAAMVFLAASVAVCGEAGAQTGAEVGIIIDAMKKFYDVTQLLERWTFGDRAARELRWELDGIHSRIDTVEDSVRKLARTVDLAVVDSKLTAMQGARGQVEAALDYQMMSGYMPAAEVSAAAAANTLREWYYYEMPTATWPRFEPRVATISFVEAVTAWLALRAANNQPLDDTLRAKLHGYAGRLEEIAARTRDSVSCRMGCSATWVPGICLPQVQLPDEPPPPCPEELMRGSYLSCSDGITRTTENLPGAPLCQAENWEESLPDLARTKGEERYAPQEFERVAALWRRIASQ